jgi:hypothetical protein
VRTDRLATERSVRTRPANGIASRQAITASRSVFLPDAPANARP